MAELFPYIRRVIFLPFVLTVSSDILQKSMSFPVFLLVYFLVKNYQL